MMLDFLKEIEIHEDIINAFESADEIAIDSLARLQSLYQQFVAKQIPFNIFKASIEDLENRLLKNLNKHHHLTLEKRELKWTNMILDFKIFKLGSLRYQIFPMDYQEIERDGFDAMPLSSDIKKEFYETRPLLNIHIEANTDLSPKAVQASFEMARDFFRQTFPQFQFDGFVTRTWLIHPGIVSLLNPQSNIAQFAQHFKIIASNKAQYQALQRVYQSEDLAEISRMDKQSDLEKSIYQNLNKLGVSFGFMPF